MQGATCQTGKLRDASYRVVPDKRAAPARPRRARRSRIVSVSVIHGSSHSPSDARIGIELYAFCVERKPVLHIADRTGQLLHKAESVYM